MEISGCFAAGVALRQLQLPFLCLHLTANPAFHGLAFQYTPYDRIWGHSCRLSVLDRLQHLQMDPEIPELHESRLNIGKYWTIFSPKQHYLSLICFRWTVGAKTTLQQPQLLGNIRISPLAVGGKGNLGSFVLVIQKRKKEFLFFVFMLLCMGSPALGQFLSLFIFYFLT